MVAPSLEPVEEPRPRRKEGPSAQDEQGTGILFGGIVADNEKGILVRDLEDDAEEMEEEPEEPQRKKSRFINMN